MMMKRLVSLTAGVVLLCGTAPATAAPDDGVQGYDSDRTRAAVGRETGEAVPPPITFYCCDNTGEPRCNVDTPGPAGEPCFCPGLVPAGRLCLPGPPPGK